VPSPLFTQQLGTRRVTIVATERLDGDVHPQRVAGPDLLERQLRATGGRWIMLDEVHSTAVVDVDDVIDHDDRDDPGVVTAGVGDVLVTCRPAAQVAVWTADCAPIFLLADDGTVVGAHGGWKGLADGVVDVAADTARRGGGRVVAAVLGPVIGPCCYEFSADDLRSVALGTHAHPAAIAGRTTDGAPALDVTAAVRTALAHRGIRLDVVGSCTGCDDRWYSHRVRADMGRHATVAIIEAAP